MTSHEPTAHVAPAAPTPQDDGGASPTGPQPTWSPEHEAAAQAWAAAETARRPSPLFGPGAVRQMLADSAYLLLGLPITIASFTVLVTGLSLAAGLLITVIGIPVAVATLLAAEWFGRLDRARLRGRGTVLPPLQYAPLRGSGLRGMLNTLADPLRWAAVIHGIVAMAVSILTWTVLVTWWAGALGGLTYWFWERWLPHDASGRVDSQGLAELLDLPMSEAQLNLLVGLVFVLTMIPVLRWCAELHAGLARMLLSGTSSRYLSEQVADLEARRTAAAAAETQSLRRLERDIHDGPQQRLVRLGMDLSVAERHLDDDPATARELLAAARAQTAETLAELRALSRGIAPPVLADRGLAAALAAVAARASVPTSVDVSVAGDDRPSAPVESAAYFLVSEALTNIAKHSCASMAAVRVWGDRASGALSVEVRDDGVGGADVAKGHGLAGLVDRVEGLGGLLTIASPDGGPTVVHATLPWV